MSYWVLKIGTSVLLYAVSAYCYDAFVPMNNTYRLERKGKQIWVVLRDALAIGAQIKYGSGSRWTVREVKN